jgi:hypothetical protein
MMDTPEQETPTPVRLVIPEPGGLVWFRQVGQQLRLPSGIIGVGESLNEGVERIAEEEIGLHVEIERWLCDFDGHYLMARAIDGVPHPDTIKLPISETIDRIGVFDQAAIGAACGTLKRSLHESQIPDDLKLALNVICLPLFPEGEREEKDPMAQKSPAQYLAELQKNMSLNQQDIERSLHSLLEQELQGVQRSVHGRQDEMEDQLALHGRRYDSRGGLLQWTPERKPSPPPKPTF